jgi:hypothetical protein
VALGKDSGSGQFCTGFQAPGLDQVNDLIHDLPEDWFFIISI